MWTCVDHQLRRHRASTFLKTEDDSAMASSLDWELQTAASALRISSLWVLVMISAGRRNDDLHHRGVGSEGHTGRRHAHHLSDPSCRTSARLNGRVMYSALNH